MGFDETNLTLFRPRRACETGRQRRHRSFAVPATSQYERHRNDEKPVLVIGGTVARRTETFSATRLSNSWVPMIDHSPSRAPGLLTWRCGSCKAWVGFGFVTQDEVCSGVASLWLVEQVAEGSERVGGPWRGEGVEADEQPAVAGDDVAGGRQGFADQGVCLVACAGVVAVQGGGQGGFGVVGGHPDGVGDLLDLGLVPAPVGGQVAEPDPGREGSPGVFSCGEFPVGGPR